MHVMKPSLEILRAKAIMRFPGLAGANTFAANPDECRLNDIFLRL
jgi:hypothetical protein